MIIAAFIVGVLVGTFFTWLIISIRIVGGALSQTHEEE